MIRCPACQASNDDRAIFCTSCGALVNQEIASNTNPQPAAPPPAPTFQGYGQQPPTTAPANPSAYAGGFGQQPQNTPQPYYSAQPQTAPSGYTLPQPTPTVTRQQSPSPNAAQQPIFTPPTSATSAYTPPVEHYTPTQQGSGTPQPSGFAPTGQSGYTPPTSNVAAASQNFAPSEQLLASFSASIPGTVTAGRLQVYPTRLIFTDTVQAFVGNKNQTIMAYHDIADLSLTNTLGLIPNGLVVRTKSGSVHTFACWERERIIALVRQYM